MVKQIWVADDFIPVRDAPTFDTRDEAEAFERAQAKKNTLAALYADVPEGCAAFIVKYWDAIKAIMEPKDDDAKGHPDTTTDAAV